MSRPFWFQRLHHEKVRFGCQKEMVEGVLTEDPSEQGQSSFCFAFLVTSSKKKGFRTVQRPEIGGDFHEGPGLLPHHVASFIC